MNRIIISKEIHLQVAIWNIMVNIMYLKLHTYEDIRKKNIIMQIFVVLLISILPPILFKYLIPEVFANLIAI